MNRPDTSERQLAPWREHLHEVIFEADTLAGRLFDVALLVLIVVSIVVVCLDSVAPLRDRFGRQLRLAEWMITILFTVEYVLRLVCVRRPLRYALSFFGLVDLLAVVPTYLSLVITGAQSLLVIRSLRLLRVFRVLKLSHLLGEARMILDALRASRAKILVFMFAVLTIVTVVGATMYVIEGEESGFDSIPRGIYWAIVTLTTVGFGDITPRTPLGQALAALVMILGYAIIAVPTGIVTAELTRVKPRQVTTRACPDCGDSSHDADARHCKYCGSRL
jgi:voltage-gated potassium channel